MYSNVKQNISLQYCNISSWWSGFNEDDIKVADRY